MAARNELELLFKPIDEIGLLYRNKKVSPVEVTKAALGLLEELEPKLNAFITVLGDEALQKACEAEAVFARGETVGKLYGIPVSIKDLFRTKGIKTTVASRILNDHIPGEDSALYTALNAAGAIVFGKNNMLEFAYGSMHPDYGQCNNPWDLNRTAGGSSTGSAAAVASGIGFASIGTDTGGSIRLPSSFCGIAGLKPTYDTVSRQGLFHLSHSLDHIGPLTRTVKDNAIVLESISSKKPNYDAVFTGSIKGMKIGVIRSLADNLTHLEVAEAVNAAIAQLGDLGAELVDIEITGIDTVMEIAFPILLAEASYYHKDWYPERAADYADGTVGNIKEGFNVSAVSYLEALERKRAFSEKVTEAFSKADVLVCPTSPSPATERDPSFDDTTYDYTQRTLPFNVSGHPAITVSAGLTPSQNLPVGIQFIGRHFDEAAIYRVADAFQTAAGGYKRPPLLASVLER
ncbi:amidase [Planomicrobium sp. CPCC 101110]|uniref:amidase n=1 Tax=Planomicrobium sp. CPCC 101110 TaxID=2599619 RepID=UPI0011B78585|nr:amidase [Planomicrobium sp. CPCC 101110]TWT25349.1 amidase [Planomicrobium sp. CPCC 101110]